jgi:thymidylate synthase
MDITFIKARDLNEAWWKCIREVLTKGHEYTIEIGSYVGQKRKEFDFVVVQIEHPGTRPLVPTVPEGVPPPSDIDYVEKDYLPYLMSNLKQANETYTYGEDIEQQFEAICKMYKKGFNTNQATITVGNRDSIFCSDPPCLRLIDTRVRYGKLHYVVYFRSWDLYAGFPSNLAGIQLMKEFMASEIGVEDGEIIAVSKGMHLYEYNWEVARAVARL